MKQKPISLFAAMLANLAVLAAGPSHASLKKAIFSVLVDRASPSSLQQSQTSRARAAALSDLPPEIDHIDKDMVREVIAPDGTKALYAIGYPKPGLNYIPTESPNACFHENVSKIRYMMTSRDGGKTWKYRSCFLPVNGSPQNIIGFLVTHHGKNIILQNQNGLFVTPNIHLLNNAGKNILTELQIKPVEGMQIVEVDLPNASGSALEITYPNPSTPKKLLAIDASTANPAVLAVREIQKNGEVAVNQRTRTVQLEPKQDTPAQTQPAQKQLPVAPKVSATAFPTPPAPKKSYSARLPLAGKCDSTGTQRVLTVLIDFERVTDAEGNMLSNSRFSAGESQQYTNFLKEEWNSSDPGTFRSFLKQASSGKVDTEGTVIGPITAPGDWGCEKDFSDKARGGDSNQNGTLYRLLKIAKDQIDLSAYDRVVFVYKPIAKNQAGNFCKNSFSTTGCTRQSGAGTAVSTSILSLNPQSTDGRPVEETWKDDLYHESMHTFGFHHHLGRFYRSKNAFEPKSEDFTLVDGVDTFAVTGIKNRGIPSGVQRLGLKWLDESRTLEIPGEGSVDLSPAGAGEGIELLQIPRSFPASKNTGDLYLEFRSPEISYPSGGTYPSRPKSAYEGALVYLEDPNTSKNLKGHFPLRTKFTPADLLFFPPPSSEKSVALDPTIHAALRGSWTDPETGLTIRTEMVPGNTPKLRVKVERGSSLAKVAPSKPPTPATNKGGVAIAVEPAASKFLHESDANTPWQKLGTSSSLLLVYTSAIWCGPCKKLRFELEQFIFKDESITSRMNTYVVKLPDEKVDSNNTPQAVRFDQYLNSIKKIPFPGKDAALFDARKLPPNRFENLPELFFIKNGALAAYFAGSPTVEQLKQMINALLPGGPSNAEPLVGGH